MSLNTLQKHWLFLSKKHQLKVDIPFVLVVDAETQVTADVRLKGYGAPKGILLFSSMTAAQELSSQLMEMGYTASSFGMPLEREVESDEGLDELLNDWGKFAEDIQ